MSDDDRQYPFENKELARRAGRKGGHATAKKNRRKGLALDKLGDLETLADCKRWLATIGRHVLAGDLDKGDADVGIRAVRAWMEAAGASLASQALEELRAEVADLQEQLKRPRAA